jgi:ATP-dependent Lon protease
MNEPTDLGLFPLGLVILPGERLPLHIFEPRYRELVADCVLEDRPFVLVLATDAGVARIGCTARFVELTRRFADGRMNLIVEGGERVEIVEQAGGHGYLSARVQIVPDEPSTPDPAAAQRLRERFQALSEEVTGGRFPTDRLPDVPLSYQVAGALDVDTVIKQRLLETREETERLELVDGLLEAALAGLDRQKVAAERAPTNGKVQH